MNDYKTQIEKFVDDLYKKYEAKIDVNDEMRQSFDTVTKAYNKVSNQLEKISKRLNDLNPIKLDDPIIDNAQFIDLMGISIKTAQSWRDDGKVSYSQVGNKIYYRASDIKALLDNNFRKATKIIISHEK